MNWIVFSFILCRYFTYYSYSKIKNHIPPLYSQLCWNWQKNPDANVQYTVKSVTIIWNNRPEYIPDHHESLLELHMGATTHWLSFFSLNTHWSFYDSTHECNLYTSSFCLQPILLYFHQSSFNCLVEFYLKPVKNVFSSDLQKNVFFLSDSQIMNTLHNDECFSGEIYFSIKI